MIEIKDIEKLAELSRIKLSDEEKGQMRKEIVSILSYIDQIKQVSGDTVTHRKKNVVRNVLREDKDPHEGGIHTEAILHNAPKRQGNYLKVKKIL